MLKLREAQYPFDRENGRTNKEGGKKKRKKKKKGWKKRKYFGRGSRHEFPVLYC